MSASGKASALPGNGPADRTNRLRRMLAAIGRQPLNILGPLVEFAGLSAAVLWQGCRPANWRRTLADEFLRQCRSVGVCALSFILVSGILIGLAMVFQAIYWLNVFGQSAAVGKILVLVLIREIGPLLVALIVLGRSGSVNMVELGQLRSSGQLQMLDAQGVDPFLFFIVSRCWATALSAFCLNILFVVVALAVGFTAWSVAMTAEINLGEFVNYVLAAMGVREYAVVALKPLIAGGLIALITCTTGLSGGAKAARAADVLPAGFVKSVLAVFITSGLLTVLL